MLTIESLSFAYDSVHILKNIHLKLDRGKLIHLKGANGVGKSTFLKIISGILPIQEGSVYFQDEDQKRFELKKYCEYLPAESNGLHLKLDAYSNLVFWLQLRGLPIDRKKIYHLMDAWGIGHKLVRQNIPLQHFSTGMKRRIALLRLILSQTECWLVDEPVYGLDKHGVKLFIHYLKEHIQNGGMAIIVSHDEVIFNKQNIKNFTLNPNKHLETSQCLS